MDFRLLLDELGGRRGGVMGLNGIQPGLAGTGIMCMPS